MRSPEPKIITRTDWDAHGESLWSILSKLSLLNNFSFAEFKECFGKPIRSKQFSSTLACDLNNLMGIRQTFVAKTVGLTHDELTLSEIKPYSIAEQGGRVLQYCSCCIRNGFHSPIHQSSIGTHCLWHPHIALQQGCPTCDAPVSYSIEKNFVDYPYQCLHGHWLGGQSPLSSAWSGNRSVGRLLELVQIVGQAKRLVFDSAGPTPAIFQSGVLGDEDLPMLLANARISGASALMVRISPPQPEIAEYQPAQLRNAKFAIGRFILRKDRVFNMPAESRLRNPELLEDLYETFEKVEFYVRDRVLKFHGACSGFSVWDGSVRYETCYVCRWRAAFTLWLDRHHDCSRRYRGAYIGSVKEGERQWWELLHRFSSNEKLFPDVNFALINLDESEKLDVVKFTTEYVQNIFLSDYFNIANQLSKFQPLKSTERNKCFQPGIALEKLVFPRNESQVHAIDSFEIPIDGASLHVRRCLSQKSLEDLELDAKYSH